MREDLWNAHEGKFDEIDLVTLRQHSDPKPWMDIIRRREKYLRYHNVRMDRFDPMLLHADMEMEPNWVWSTRKIGSFFLESETMRGNYYLGPKTFQTLEDILYMSPFYLQKATVARHHFEEEDWNYLILEYRLRYDAKYLKYTLFPDQRNSDNRLYWNSVDFIRGILTWYFPKMDVSGYFHDDMGTSGGRIGGSPGGRG